MRQACLGMRSSIMLVLLQLVGSASFARSAGFVAASGLKFVDSSTCLEEIPVGWNMWVPNSAGRHLTVELYKQHGSGRTACPMHVLIFHVAT